jgi:formate dehydrogenase (coenzyme F420) alpha subunit
MDFKYVPSTCPYCGTGCGINLAVKDGKVTGIQPWHRNPVNEGKVCIRGNKSHEFVNNPARLTTPLIKKDGKFVEASWEDAYKEIAAKLKTVKPEEVGVVASARACNEDNYLLKSFAATVLKTANIDYCGRRCNADAVRGITEAFGSGAMTNSIPDIAEAKAILVIGSNPFDENPLAGRRIMQAQLNGAQVIVAAAKKTATAKQADLYIPCNPGTEVALVNGIMNAILKAGTEKKDFIAAKTKDFEKCKAVVSGAAYSADAVAKTCGISAELITKAAEIYAAAPAAAVITSAGATSGDLVRAAANLQLITGNVGKAGAGVDLLRGKSNAQGAMDMGCVPSENGSDVPAMIAGAAAGKIKAMYVMGENIASAGAHVPDALGKLDFLVVQDMFMTETAEKAHVILPSAAFAERDGTFTNSERRVQRVRKAVEAVGTSRADCTIICELAKAMGHEKEFSFATAEQVFGEIAKHIPAYAGITYAKLERPEGIQWPAAGGEFGTAVLYSDKFATKDGKAVFSAVEYKAVEATSAEFPFAVAAKWPMGTLSVHTPSVVREWPGPIAAINQEDAAALKIQNGDKVKVSGKTGSATLTAHVTGNVKKGVVAMPAMFAAATVRLEKVPEEA